MCDDMFFARYRASSTASKSLAETKSNYKSLNDAANALLKALYGDAYTEPEKHNVMSDLLDTRILPATDGTGVQFTSERIKDRYIYI